MCCEVEGIQSKVVFLDILYVTHEVMSDCKKKHLSMRDNCYQNSLCCSTPLDIFHLYEQSL